MQRRDTAIKGQIAEQTDSIVIFALILIACNETTLAEVPKSLMTGPESFECARLVRLLGGRSGLSVEQDHFEWLIKTFLGVFTSARDVHAVNVEL